MADLGAIAGDAVTLAQEMAVLAPIALSGDTHDAVTLAQEASGVLPRNTIQSLGEAGGSETALGGRDDVEGEPDPPSLRLDAPGVWRFRWTVAAGSHGITVQVKQVENVEPRPTITVKANPDIGVMADVVEVARDGVGWVLAGPLIIEPTSDGAVFVELRNRLQRQPGRAPCYFDNLVQV